VEIVDGLSKILIFPGPCLRGLVWNCAQLGPRTVKGIFVMRYMLLGNCAC